MRKEYILTDDEKAQKRQKIEENRYIKKLCSTTAVPGGASSVTVPAATATSIPGTGNKIGGASSSCGSGPEDVELVPLCDSIIIIMIFHNISSNNPTNYNNYNEINNIIIIKTRIIKVITPLYVNYIYIHVHILYKSNKTSISF